MKEMRQKMRIRIEIEATIDYPTWMTHDDITEAIQKATAITDAVGGIHVWIDPAETVMVDRDSDEDEQRRGQGEGNMKRYLSDETRERAIDTVCEQNARVSPEDVKEMSDQELIEELTSVLETMLTYADEFDPADEVRSEVAKIYVRGQQRAQSANNWDDVVKYTIMAINTLDGN